MVYHFHFGAEAAFFFSPELLLFLRKPDFWVLPTTARECSWSLAFVFTDIDLDIVFSMTISVYLLSVDFGCLH